mgnify:CR=1 FL=1
MQLIKGYVKSPAERVTAYGFFPVQIHWSIHTDNRYQMAQHLGVTPQQLQSVLDSGIADDTPGTSYGLSGVTDKESDIYKHDTDIIFSGTFATYKECRDSCSLDAQRRLAG